MSSTTGGAAATPRGTLVKMVEEHLTSLVREANCVKRHCKRARLHQMDPSDRHGSIRRRLHADDINMVLQWRGSEKLYATGTVIPNDTTTANGEVISKSLDLEEYLKRDMQLRPPTEVGLTTHWLAVDGQQPDIPQNPPPRGSSSKTISPVALIQDDDEQDLQYHHGSTGDGGVRVQQLLPLLLSEELQLYFSRITMAIQRGGATPTTRQQQDAALLSVARDPGLQELVPFFTKYISQELYRQVTLGNPDHGRTLVRLASALLQNPHLHLELHLHQCLPALMTCIVAKRFTTSSSVVVGDTANHWALRREAALTVMQACQWFGNDYPTLKARVLRTLCDAISPDKARTTQYGGIVGISLFGAKAVDAFLLPVISEYWKQWETELGSTTDREARTELLMCQQAVLVSYCCYVYVYDFVSLVWVGVSSRTNLSYSIFLSYFLKNALGVFLRRVRHEEQSSRASWSELEETFGDLMVGQLGDENEYFMSVV